MISTWKKVVGVTLGALALWAVGVLGLPQQARAQAEIPFYASVEVEPNVLFVMDVSGSMSWNFQYLDGANRTRMDAAKKILTGQYPGSSGGNNRCPSGWTYDDGNGDVSIEHCRQATHNHHGQPHLNMGVSPNFSGDCPAFDPLEIIPGASVHVDHGVCHQYMPSYTEGNGNLYYRNSTWYVWVPNPPPPPTTSQGGIIDTFGGLVNFALTTYAGNGSTSTTSPGRVLSFPRSGNNPDGTQFENTNLESLKNAVLSLNPGGNTPTTQAMRDAGCWLMGETEMNKAFLSVATQGDPDIPFPNGGEQVSTTLWVNQCPYDLDDPHLYDCSGNVAGCDPSFACRRTFIILITDGDQTSGWGHSNGCVEGSGGSQACQDAHRKIVASALRRSTYLNSEADVRDRGVKTFVALMAPCDVNDSDNNGNGISDDCEAANNNLIREGDMWAKYGGTDATPDPDDCSKPNGDGAESFLGTSAEALEDGLRRALACILDGNYTRAEPTFIATSTNFSENFEIDGFFSIEPGSAWWRGHLQAFTFEEINEAIDAGRDPIPAFPDAGQLLTDRTSGNPRQLYVGVKEPFVPQVVIDDDPTSGALTSPVQEPPVTVTTDYPPFTTGGAAPASIASIAGISSAKAASLITLFRDEDGPGGGLRLDNGEEKLWSLGAIVNSSPLVVRPPIFDFRVGDGEVYANFIKDHATDPDVVYVGAQDGFMHAFALEDPNGNYSQGEEMWGFMPYEAVLRLPAMANGTTFTVDGAPEASTVRFHNDPSDPDDDTFHTVLLFGLRSGGFSYVALEITDPTAPKLLWQVTHPSMGRTFSRPNIGEYTMNWDGSTILRRWLMVVGAGFNGTRSDGDPIWVNPIECASVVDGQCLDESGDPIEPPPAPENVPDPGNPGIGNWILFWDIETGRFIQNVRVGDDPTDPRYNSIPGNLLAIDRNLDGSVDNVIFGDLEGRLWKILTIDPDPEEWWTDRRAADGGLGTDQGESPCIMFDQGDLADELGFPGEPQRARRPIFYAPAATFDANGFVNLIWGTGDLTDPNAVDTQDFLFAINDRDASSCGDGDADMVARDFSCDEISDQTFKQKVDDAFPYILEPGEKILSAPIIINGRFYVSTFQPVSAGNASNAGCGDGRSRFIEGPAVCYNLRPKDGDSSADVLFVSEWSEGASPPLIIGPDGRPMSVRSLGKDDSDVLGGGKIGELSIEKRNLHWVDVFGKPCMQPVSGGVAGGDCGAGGVAGP